MRRSLFSNHLFKVLAMVSSLTFLVIGGWLIKTYLIEKRISLKETLSKTLTYKNENRLSCPVPSPDQETSNSGSLDFFSLPAFLISVEPGQRMTTPTFSSGKMSFIKDGNVWWGEPEGVAYQLTSDAADQISPTTNFPVKYRLPLWSPEGKKLAFKQQIDHNIARVLISDGKSIATDDSLMIYWMLPPYWLNEDALLIPKSVVIQVELEGIEWSGAGPMFSFFDIANGCGGGGRPAWSYELSYNHHGGMDGIRATFFTVGDTLVYSTSCEQEKVERLSRWGRKSELFDLGRPLTEKASWLRNDSPQELILSLDKKLISGTINRNVVLYSADGKFIRQLTDSGKAYGPVFSPDSQVVYYADSLGEIPTLNRVDLDGENEKILFQGDMVGAISNIDVSPNNKELIFTLIEQIEPPLPAEGKWAGKTTEAIYLIDADGQNLRLFADNASQADWSPY